MATSKKRRTRQSTLDEEAIRAYQEQRFFAALTLCHMNFNRSLPEAELNQVNKKRKVVEKEYFDKTLESLLTWKSNTPELPPQEKIVKVVGKCSKPIQKQMTESDQKKDQNRLMLGKKEVEKKMLYLLEESEVPKGKEGLEVSVYGPDGEPNKMMFKMWNEIKTPVLTCGWNDFVAKYDLLKHSDFLTIWMFRHLETRKICFAVDSIRFRICRPICRKISKAVFKVDDSD